MIDWLVQNFIQNIPVYVWAFVAGAGLALYVISGLAGRFDAIKPYAVLVRGASMLLLVSNPMQYLCAEHQCYCWLVVHSWPVVLV